MEDGSSYLMEKKIEYLIEMKAKKLGDELTTALGRIKLLNEEIELLKGRFEQFESRPQTPVAPERSSVSVAPVQVEVPHITVATAASQTSPKPDANYNQRVGTLKPGDIDINSMFYYGNKR